MIKINSRTDRFKQSLKSFFGMGIEVGSQTLSEVLQGIFFFLTQVLDPQTVPKSSLNFEMFIAEKTTENRPDPAHHIFQF